MKNSKFPYFQLQMNIYTKNIDKSSINECNKKNIHINLIK